MPSVSEVEPPRTEMEMYEETKDERPGDVQGDSGILCSAAGLCPLTDHFISRSDLQLVFIFRHGMKVYGIQ